jgi:hypothetical protein
MSISSGRRRMAVFEGMDTTEQDRFGPSDRHRSWRICMPRSEIRRIGVCSAAAVMAVPSDTVCNNASTCAAVNNMIYQIPHSVRFYGDVVPECDMRPVYITQSDMRARELRRICDQRNGSGRCDCGVEICAREERATCRQEYGT